MKDRDLGYARINYEAPIIYITFKEAVEIGFFEIRELTFHSQNLSEGKPYLVFADARAGVTLTPMGMKEASEKDHAPLHRGTAVLVASSVLKTAMNLFGSIRRPAYPYKAFTRKEHAVEWLLTLNYRTGTVRAA